ncbi:MULTISPECIES: DUF397 domain-containing protein [Streptomyces]|uniref:DUF397 domain-containing protein n=2 Tax=Streptomyces TaxID=1883 RepID=A0A3M8FA37_9ACTN|nr:MULTISPECIES: DUF397 domain-containing protein [Streptomyces]KNE80409.1 toxin-antitoxin system, toxin component [Streptomyces fradiae]OFA53117.1 DUF397 domain-containing protein [Streptomyces fradiae]PQM22603.1 DUF397 domain-containing protein [Streptomyces xinghaiensis]RKM96431.1 DUF397 domain-containing protein [Streptomyces xinghaiensis]RNC74418.1 DUF397 domain-containing protein [Streptomyces xinghaiensis]
MSSGMTELAWFKSSYSGSQGDDCVEVAITEQAVHVRDSKDTTRPAFTVGREGWASFMGFASGR